MNNFVLTDKGAVIEITNNSTEQIITNNEGFISPTLTPLGNTVSNEIKPAFTIQIPSFVSYKINNIAPGDSISFVVTKPDEVFYYLGIANSKIEGISVNVTPITDDTTLQDKTITPTTTEQVVTADEGYDGLGTVTVEAVTASIDENITAENIKKDVEILGVTGSYEGSGGGNSTGIVKFYDAKGNIVNQYSSSDFLQLNAMPANPTQNGLTCQGWNWSLADAKSYVGQYGNLNIGQMYTFEDEDTTKLYITLHEGILSPTLALCPNGTLTIDWGDNSVTDTMIGEDDTTLVYLNHTYSAPGSYVISVTPTEGSTFGLSSAYQEGTTILCKDDESFDENRLYYMSLKCISIGKNMSYFDEYTFMDCNNSLTIVTLLSSEIDISLDSNYTNTYLIGVIPSELTEVEANLYVSNCNSIIIPNSVLSINSDTFNNCSKLVSITIPNSITSFSLLFEYCEALTSILLPNSIIEIVRGPKVDVLSFIIPDSVTLIHSYSFGGSLITSITIPNANTIGSYAFVSSNLKTAIISGNIGERAFDMCEQLTSVVLSNCVQIEISAFSGCLRLTNITIPNSVTSIGDYAFSECSSLTSITIPNSVTSFRAGTFRGCTSLTSITIPSSSTSIKVHTFLDCTSLENVTIPNNVTSIDSAAFCNCSNLTNITIPNKVIWISEIAFSQCSALGLIEFLPTTPPDIYENTFGDLPTDCIIYVPNGTLSAYTSATNYPDPSTYTYIERSAT